MIHLKLSMKLSKVVKAFENICLILFFGMLILTLMQILFRYVLSISVPWTEEMARLLYSLLIFTAIVVIEAENDQIKTTYFIEKLPYGLRFAAQLLINLASIIFVGSFAYGSVIALENSWIYTYGTVPWLSIAVVYIPIIVCAPFIIWYLLKQVILFKAWASKPSEYDIEEAEPK